MPSSSLSLNEISYFVYLGCTKSEQAQVQEIQLSILIEFNEPPPACQTDRLEETYCYSQLNDEVEKVCQGKAYATIEHLGFQCWNAISSLIHSQDKLTIKIDKLHPPLAKRLKNASFSLSGIGSRFE